MKRVLTTSFLSCPVSKVTSIGPPAVQEPHQEQEAIITEAIATTTAAPTKVRKGGSITFDKQMMNELLSQHSDPFVNMSFVLGTFPPASTALSQSTATYRESRATRETEILAQIEAEMEAAAHGGNSKCATTVVDPTPLAVTSSGDTLVGTSAPVPPPVVDPTPPTPREENIPLSSSSEEYIDIMPSSEEDPPKGTGSKQKTVSGSSGSTLKRKPKKKK